MNTQVKKCKNCGWECPMDSKYKTCIVCGQFFSTGVCKRCGKVVDNLVPGHTLCRQCYNERDMEYKRKNRVRDPEYTQMIYERMQERLERKLVEWKKKVSRYNNMHTLTEAEWLEACKHFNGCALCGSESIDARGYFITFKDGGKYNACNVIPICNECATRQRLQSNPFVFMHDRKKIGKQYSHEVSSANLKDIVDYFKAVMERNKNEQRR